MADEFFEMKDELDLLAEMDLKGAKETYRLGEALLHERVDDFDRC